MYKFDFRNIAKLRKSLGLTQSEFAKKIRKPRQTIHQWEEGIYCPNARNIAKMCNAFNVSPNYFFENKIRNEENINY